MQKKMVGILASVAAAHAVLVVGVIAGGGCSNRQILGPHTYVDGPELSQIPAATDQIEPKKVNEPQVLPDSDVNPLAITPPPVIKDPVTPPPPVTPVAPASKGGVSTYIVKRGDTLSGIAYKHGVRISDLAACNNLSGKAINHLRIGQKLTIPDGSSYKPGKAVRSPRKVAPKKPRRRTSAKPAPLPADGIYVVKSGDSLDRIGRRYGVSAKAIAKENNIALTKVLQIGDKLRIPGKAPKAPQTDITPPVPVKPAENTGTDLPVSNVDDLDPNIGLDSANNGSTGAAPAAAPAADTTVPAATPAADTPSTPAADEKTESTEVAEDTTIEEYCKKIAVSEKDLRRLNPNLPADGKLKGGTFLIIPSLSL